MTLPFRGDFNLITDKDSFKGSEFKLLSKALTLLQCEWMANKWVELDIKLSLYLQSIVFEGFLCVKFLYTCVLTCVVPLVFSSSRHTLLARWRGGTRRALLCTCGYVLDFHHHGE